MKPYQSRAEQRPATRPLPPIRTLGSQAERRPAPFAVWIPPVRSGLLGAPVTREPSIETAPRPWPALDLRPELAGPPTPAPAVEWPTPASFAETEAEPEAELVLEDEVWNPDAEPWLEAAATGVAAETVIELEATGPGPETLDAVELANRLERLADQLRRHGRAALADAVSGADPVETAMAAVLADLMGHPEA